MKEFPILLILAAPLVGCGYPSDYNQANAETRSHLRGWADIVSALAQLDVKVEEFGSTQDILSQYKHTRLFDAYYEQLMKEDSWGKPYIWIVKGDEDKKIILIGSGGKNGVWEGGQNDDLYVIVELKAGEPPQIHEKPIPRGWSWLWPCRPC
jgi:hypothetical protein